MEEIENEKKKGFSAGNYFGARQSAFPSYFPPMLASLSDNPFSGKAWIYEPKMDGMRCIAFVDGNNVKLLSRRGQNITAQYPALSRTLPSICKWRIILDGEIIALNEQGKPSFQLLQKRMNLLKVTDIDRADARIPVHFFVFDTVFVQDFNMAHCCLLDRKDALREVLRPSDSVAILKFFEGDGRIAYDACIENGFEGIVAKRRESIYEVGRRSPSWVKVKAQKTAEFVVAGYSVGQGSRSSTFGSLLLGYYDDYGKLIYAGSAGTGFDERLLADMIKRMELLKSATCPFASKPEDKKDAVWLRPELVAEIKFMDFTDEMHLRNPVFLHLRHDIRPGEVRLIQSLRQGSFAAALKGTECSGKSLLVAEAGLTAAEAGGREYAGGTPALPGVSGVSATAALKLSSLPVEVHPAEVPRVAMSEERSVGEPESVSDLDLSMRQWQVEAESVIAQLSGRERNMPLTVEHATIALTNLDKVLFARTENNPAVSKRDFIKLIAFLSPYILFHIQYRPLTMIRAPGGTRSRSFYQKHWNLDVPDFIETILTEPADPSRRDQIFCNNVAALVFLAQNNILEYHSWLSRVRNTEERVLSGPAADLEQLDLPDYMVFDLDMHGEGENEDKIDSGAFKKAAEAAWRLRELLSELGLPAFLKTSGRNGLHLFIPVKPELRFDEVRVLTETIARHAEGQWTDLFSTSAVEARKLSKVFLDYQANTRGKTVAAPYTPRLTSDATISTPIDWKELDSISPQLFNQHSIRERLNEKKDLWKGMLDQKTDLFARFARKNAPQASPPHVS